MTLNEKTTARYWKGAYSSIVGLPIMRQDPDGAKLVVAINSWMHKDEADVLANKILEILNNGIS